MSKYKMIAFDMDGTLLNSQKKVRKETLDAINKAFDGGKEVILCTGRALAELEEYIELIPRMRYMVMTSGAIVYDIKEKKDIYANEISVEIMDEILNYIKDKDIMPQMITKESIVQKKDYEHMEDFHMGIYKPMFNEVAVKVENMLDFYNDNKQPVAKLNLYHTSSEDREETRKAIEGLDVVLANAETTSLEVSAKNTTKGLGLQKLCEHLGISIDEAIAVGDADNDLDVLNIKYNDKLDNDHLYKVAVFQEILPEPDFHFSRLNGNGLWSCKNGIGGEIEKGNKPVAGFAYKLIKVLDINK